MNLKNSVWICPRKGKKGTTYNVRWLDPRTGKVRSKTCGTGTQGKSVAKRFSSKIRDQLSKGQLKDPIAKPWPTFVKEFLAAKRAKKQAATVQRYELTLETFKGICEPATVLSVTPQMVEQFVSTRRWEHEVTASSVNCDLRHLRAAMNTAMRWYNLPSNPVSEVEYLEVAEKDIRVLGVDEVQKLLETCRGIKDKGHALRWEAFVYLAVTCGLRRGELLNLRWKDIDEEGRHLRLVCRDDWRTKSGKNRVAFLDDHAVNLLMGLRSQQASQLRLSEYVFVSETGKKWGKNLSRDFQKLVEKSKLPYFTMHDLRRTFCTALANANVQEAIVQKLAGHASMTTTLKYYTKVSAEAARLASNSLPYRVPENPSAGQTTSANPAQKAKGVS